MCCLLPFFKCLQSRHHWLHYMARVSPSTRETLHRKSLFRYPQNRLNRREKSISCLELLSSQAVLHITEEIKVRRCQVRRVRWMGALMIPFSSMNLCDAAAVAACGRAWTVNLRPAAPACSLRHSESGPSISFW
jgi:hypothetical protein